jgi:hypothetical protein
MTIENNTRIKGGKEPFKAPPKLPKLPPPPPPPKTTKK